MLKFSKIVKYKFFFPKNCKGDLQRVNQMFRVRRHFGFISIGWSSSLSLVSNRKFKIDDGSFICLYVNSASEFFLSFRPEWFLLLLKQIGLDNVYRTCFLIRLSAEESPVVRCEKCNKLWHFFASPSFLSDGYWRRRRRGRARTAWAFRIRRRGLMSGCFTYVLCNLCFTGTFSPAKIGSSEILKK